MLLNPYKLAERFLTMEDCKKVSFLISFTRNQVKGKEHEITEIIESYEKSGG